MLQDDRIKYNQGTTDTETEDQKQMRFLMDVYQRAVDSGQEEDAQKIVRQINELDKKMILENAEIADRMRKSDGGKLKEIPEDNKGLAKLPKEVRNKMGYFAEGGPIRYSDVADMHDDPKAVKELIIFMEKVGDKSNQVIDNVVIPYMRKTGKSFAEGLDYVGNKVAEGGQKAADMIDELEERFKKQEGGEIDNQMSMLMNNEQEMLPDEEMEDNYMDFILDEALTEEEEDMLMSKLEQDEQLSMLFDKVVEVASEFAGSGPVEGPGTGVSDSIPARLSDGEFVFTAKAVEEIGADNLMAMMKDAEMKADERQGMANGGEMDEETVVVKGDDEPARQEIRVVKETVDSAGRMVEDEDEISKNIKSNMMLDPNQQHVRS